MGILIVVFGAFCLISSFYFVVIRHMNKIGYTLEFCLILIIPMLFIGNKPSNEFRYYADVYFGENEYTIYFENFQKIDDDVFIDRYAKYGTVHWLDFDRYDIIEEPLTVYINGDNDEFIYKDRITGEEYGCDTQEENIATQ